MNKLRLRAWLCALLILRAGFSGALALESPKSCYEIFLYSFRDGNGDGVGDLAGAAEAIDYIADMGFDAVWLTPVVSAASYHKYDAVDYLAIDPEYGTADDFRRFLSECGARDIRVILDLVVNHTSDRHPWFQSACKSISVAPCGQAVCTAPGLCRAHNPYCEYYNFSQSDAAPSGYTALGNGWCYESVFWSGMPDLNLNNARVRSELEKVVDFYMDMGASGFRLDAALHYTHSAEGNAEVLRWLTEYAKAKKRDAYIVAEVWAGLNEALPYYKSGVDSLFNFSFGTASGRTAKTLVYKGAANSASAYETALLNLQAALGTAVDAPFGSNHDTGRIAGFMRKDEAKIKMYAALNLTMTGCAFVYYGEELGMSGSGKDENARAPMYWHEDAEASGMTLGPPAMDAQTHKFGSLDAQIGDDQSIYHFYKALLALRSASPAISRGETSAIAGIDDEDICAIRKTWEGESVYLVYNLSETEPARVAVPDGLMIETALYAARDGGFARLEEDSLECPPMSLVALRPCHANRE